MTNDMEIVAKQLRKPEGQQGIDMAKRMNVSNATMVQSAIESLQVKPGNTVIEIGAGNGLTSLGVIDSIRNDGSYIVIDYSKDMLSLVAENCKKHNFENLKLVHGDCLEIEEQFNADGVFASNLLYFIEDIPSLVQKLRKWCKVGARVVFAVRSKESMVKLPFTDYNFILRTKDEYLDEFTKAGMAIKMNTYEDQGKTLDGELVSMEYHIISAAV